jgi:hypothetical protein
MRARHALRASSQRLASLETKAAKGWRFSSPEGVLSSVEQPASAHAHEAVREYGARYHHKNSGGNKRPPR